MRITPSIPPQTLGAYSAAPGQQPPVHLPTAIYQQTQPHGLAQGQTQAPIVIVQPPAPVSASGWTPNPAMVAAVAGGGVLAVALLLAVAVVAVAVALGAVSLTLGWLILKSLPGARR